MEISTTQDNAPVNNPSKADNNSITDSATSTNVEANYSVNILSLLKHKLISEKNCSNISTNPNEWGYFTEDKRKVNTIRKIQWSPDGTRLLATSDDRKIRVFETSADKFNDSEESNQIKANVNFLAPCFSSSEVGSITDCCWYRFMNSTVPSTCCYFSCSHGCPVHCFDGFTGKLRAVYPCTNETNEIMSVLSLGVSYSNVLFCCSSKNKKIYQFDVSRQQKAFRTIDCFNDKTHKNRQNGLLSCLDFTPFNQNIFLVGSYNKTVGLYDQRCKESLNILIKDQHKGGLVQVMFLKTSDLVFLTGCRKDSLIRVFDLRNPTASQPLTTFDRKTEETSNQKVFFDIDPLSQYIATGSDDGSVLFFDTTTGDLCSKLEVKQKKENESASSIQKNKFDCANCVAFHPFSPILATSYGERRKNAEIFNGISEEAEEILIDSDEEESADDGNAIEIDEEGDDDEKSKKNAKKSNLSNLDYPPCLSLFKLPHETYKAPSQTTQAQ